MGDNTDPGEPGDAGGASANGGGNGSGNRGAGGGGGWGQQSQVSSSGRGRDGLMHFGDGVTPPPLHSSFRREPMAYEPELVLSRAHLGAEAAASFLFENFIEFLHDDAIEDAALGLGRAVHYSLFPG